MKFRSTFLPILLVSFALVVMKTFAADDGTVVAGGEAKQTNQTTVVGNSAAFTVTAGGSAPLSYQWFNGTNISGATNLGPAYAIVPGSRIDLFNGKDLTGWTFFMRNDANPTDTWSVADGLLKCTGKPTGYIRTEQDYRDYKLTAEWRFVKIAPRADNGGILVHMQLPDKLWPPCIQCQGKHDAVGDLFLMGGAESKEHLGKDANTALPKQGESAEKPVGEWNICELVCSGKSVKVYVNGKLMNETTDSTVSSGKIGFQCEGAEFEVRKVFIEPIKPE